MNPARLNSLLSSLALSLALCVSTKPVSWYLSHFDATKLLNFAEANVMFAKSARNEPRAASEPPSPAQGGEPLGGHEVADELLTRSTSDVTDDDSRRRPPSRSAFRLGQTSSG